MNNYNIIIPVLGLELKSEKKTIILPDFTISNDVSVITFLDDSFAMQVGLSSMDLILNHPFIFAKIASPLDLTQFAEHFHSYVALFLSSLWFTKDNGVYSIYCYVQKNDTKEVKLNMRNLFFTLSSGNYGTTTFDKEEFENSVATMRKIESLSTNVNTSFDERTVKHGSIQATKGLFSGNHYNIQNRVIRATTFLAIARSTSVVPMKIANYVAILECLFTTDKDEVSHKVRENVAIFLAGTAEKKISTYNILTSAYSVRSEYLHGQELSKSNAKADKLQEICLNTDSLLRETLIKVIYENSDIFLQNLEALRNYFRSQLLK